MDRGGSFFLPSAGRCFWSASYLSRGGQFSPAQLAGLTLWYDAQQAATITGDPVSQWNDAGPGGRTLTQAAADNRPDLLTGQAAFGGRDCLDFADGEPTSQQWLARASESVTEQTSGTVWIVASFSSLGDRVVLGVSQNSAAQRYWQLQSLNVSDELRWGVAFRNGLVGTDSGVYAAGAEGVLDATEAYVLTVSSDGDAYRIWINGRQFGGGGPGSLATLGTLGNNGAWIGDVSGRDRLAVGARIVTSQPVATTTARTQVAEVVMTAPEAGAVALQQMHEYLAERYGIPLTP